MAHYTERLLWFIKRAEQTTQQAKERALRSLGITPAQQQALTVLSDHDGVTSTRLARECHVTPQTMISTVAKLEARGMLTRSPHPLHGTLIELRLTADGRDLFRRADAHIADLDDDITRGLTTSDLATLKTLLTRVAANASETL